MNITKVEVQGWDGACAFQQYGAQTDSVFKSGSAIRTGTTTDVNHWFRDGYTLVTGLLGTGKAIQEPNEVEFRWSFVDNLDTEPTGMSVFIRFSLQSSVTSQNIMAFREGSTGRLLVRTTSGGLLEVFQSNGSISYTSSQAISVGTVYELELAATSDGADADEFEVRLDRSAVSGLSGTGKDFGVVAKLNVLNFSNTSAGNLTIDDCVLRYGNGAITDSDFLSNGNKVVRLTTLFVNGDGNYTAWDKFKTPPDTADTTYANDWEQLKETTWDNFDHYLKPSAATLDKQSWTFQGFGETTGGIYCVYQHHSTLAQGSRWTTPGLRIAATDYEAPEYSDLTNWWDDGGGDGRGVLWLTNPATSVAWVDGDLDSGDVEGWVYAQTSAGGAGIGRVTQALLLVVWFEPAPTPVVDDWLYTLAQTGVGW